MDNAGLILLYVIVEKMRLLLILLILIRGVKKKQGLERKNTMDE